MNAFDWKLFPAARLATDVDLQAHWDRLNSLQLDRPSMTAEIVSAALAAYGNKAELLLVASDEGQIVAMLVLAASGLMRWCTFQPAMGIGGAWVAVRRYAAADLCRSLLRGPLGLCLSVSIRRIDASAAARQENTPDILSTDGPETTALDISGSFDDYWATRSPALHQRLHAHRKQLAEGGVEASFRVLRRPQEMAAAVARYGRLESAGRRGDDDHEIHPGNRRGRFYIQLFEAAAARGEAIVFEYLLDGKLAAIDLCLLRHGVLAVLMAACEHGNGQGLTPDLLLRKAALQHLFATGEVRRIEYRGPHSPPSALLTDEVRPSYDLAAFRWPLAKLLTSQRLARPIGANTYRLAAAGAG